MRRILNSFLQFIELDESDSIIIAATNNPKLLDQALYRRFDDILHYDMPTKNEVERLFKSKLKVNCFGNFEITEELLGKAMTLSHAEIIHACNDAIKYSILSNEDITEKLLLSMLEERVSAYSLEGA